MKFTRSFLTCILPLTVGLLDKATARHVFRHEAIEVHRRQDESLGTTTTGSILTYITPSPGATPIAVTTQSQLVSSNVPEFTLCVLPPEAFFPATAATPTTSTAPYHNYSISIPPGPGTCTTIYKPTVTMVCATTLTGIDRLYTISRCNQDVTFSSEYGYILSTPTPATTTSDNATALITPAPVIQTLTTYYLAPWAQITPGIAPNTIDKKICLTQPNGTETCVVEYYIWRTSLVTIPTTTVTSINFTTTIAGPSQLVVETFVANVTEDVTTFGMSTTMMLTWSKEVETTVAETRTTGGGTGGRTVTYTLSEVMPTTRITSTSTRKITKTVFIEATQTTTVPTVTPTEDVTDAAMESTDTVAPTADPAETSIDVASILGLGT